MRSGLVSVVLVLLFVAVPFGQMFSEELEPLENPEFAPSAPFDILIYGNSYTSANNLANLVQDGMVSGGVTTNVDSLTGGGMTLDGHSQNAQSSGHSWNTTLNDGTAWDYVVLQDQSQIPGLYRNTAYWQDSLAGAQVLDGFAEDVGAESILMMTWGRRNGDSNNQVLYPDFLSMQERLEDGYIDYRDNLSTPNRDVWIAPVGLAFKHVYENVQSSGATPENSGNLFYDLYTGDGSHPSLSGSYLASCVLYATITGNSPVGLTDSTSLSASIKLDLQEAAAATVFNETNHLTYSWQITSQNNITSPLGNLGWEWTLFGGTTSSVDRIFDVVTDSNGDAFVVGMFVDMISYGGCLATNPLGTAAGYTALFVAKFNSTGQCEWISIAYDENGQPIPRTYDRWDGKSSISLDSNSNIYISSSCECTGNNDLVFGNISFDPVHGTPGQASILAKLDNNGEWLWAVPLSQLGGPNIVEIDSNGNIWASSEYQLRKFNASGFHQLTKNYGSITDIFDLASDSFGNVYVVGGWGTGTSGELGQSTAYKDLFVHKLDSNGNQIWLSSEGQSTSSAYATSISIDVYDNIYVTGFCAGDLSLYSGTGVDHQLNCGGTTQGFVGELQSSSGAWIWVNEMVCTCAVIPSSIDVDTYDGIYVTGTFDSNTVTFGSVVLNPSGGSNDLFVVKYDSLGGTKFAFSAGSNGDDEAFGLSVSNLGEVYVVGRIDGMTNFGYFTVNSNGGDAFISKLSSDYDADLIPDINDDDDDGDYIFDLNDNCHYSPLNFTSIGALDHDGDGCRDYDEDDDDDGDMLNDTEDNCPKGMTGWVTSNITDIDGDGCMDSLEDFDDDADGFEDYDDLCPRDAGNSTFEFEKGCPDRDGDGRPDIRDPFPSDNTEWSDLDSDGTGDNSDEYPFDSTQNSDFDRDGFGDEEFGNNGDNCPLIYGNSTIDRRGCIDSDGDGWSDEGDDFPDNPNEYLDTDGDTVPDHLDMFPFDPTQKQDTDGDGYGDNADGNLGDAFPNDPTRHADSDRDSYDDDNDSFPFDSTQWSDADGDGYGDNPLGLRPDAFPLEPSQWSDVDGDGWGDNETGYRADAYPTDITQWSDLDGDGYGDNQFGINPDAYPKDPTQWDDYDQDGLGDNPNGTNPDPFVNDTDNDGYNNSIDPLPNIPTPGDLDGDGCLDEEDAFPSNPNECKDSDGDGWGDNQDSDDDNDGINDITEAQEGTDPMDASSVPVESFEIRVPGTVIGLGAWDLIGIFGGVPFFSWILFCLITRGARSRKFENLLFESKSEEELSEISRRYEFALMLRLLGSHQALRLERVRSNLEVHFNEIERKMSEDPDFDLPNEEHVMPPSIDVQGMIHTDGYEWTDHMGFKWYRVPDTGSDWSRWQ